MITHLEPDILECEVRWALRSITMNKANGGDGIPVELFQILKDDAVKVLHWVCQQIWKMQQWPQDWKRSVFVPMLPAWPCARHLVNTKEAVVRSHPTQRPSSRPAGRARGCGCACFLSWPQEINFLDFIKKKKKNAQTAQLHSSHMLVK